MNDLDREGEYHQMIGSEYNCDHCGVYVPDGEGLYFEDDRLCPDCFAATQ